MFLGSKFTYFSSDDSEDEIRTGNISSEDELDLQEQDDGEVRLILCSHQKK